MKTHSPNDAATARILVVDDNARARQSMADVLGAAGHEVESSASALDALRLLDENLFDVILTDLQMPGMNGLEFIRALETRGCESQVVMVTAFASVSSAVEAMRHGAFDYIEKPFDAEELEQLVARALAQADRDGRRSCVPTASREWESAMIGDSSAMRLLRQRIAQVAPTDETVLICGESGTGKELVARCIHAASRRQGRALVSLNCPALSPQLLESELFGHERGAFTSADAPRVGRFELAEGGTILLDEVTEIELGLQAKLLRVLQERTYERVGSSESRKADVRVVATTNRDIRQAAVAGEFRQDLYYRLAVLPIVVPPLRERRDDVPLLVRHFLGETASRTQRPGCTLDVGAIDLLSRYHWPGNVRELENLVTRACVLFAGRTIGADELRPWLLEPDDSDESHFASGDAVAKPEAQSMNRHPICQVPGRLEEMERKLIETTLDHVGGHRAKAAQVLGIGIRTLTNKLRAYGYAPRTKVFAKAS